MGKKNYISAWVHKIKDDGVNNYITSKMNFLLGKSD